MKPCSILLIFFAFTLSGFAQYPAINPDRPRIYADMERINWCHDNYNSPGNFQNDYNDFIYAYSNNWINDPELYLSGSDSSLWTWDWGSQWAKDEAFFTVFIYKISGEPLVLERCEFIAQQLISAVNNADFPNMEFYEKETFLRTISEAGGLMLDWLYDDLPSALRDELVQAMFAQNTEFMNTYVLNSNGTSYVSSHNTWNCIITIQNALVLHDSSGLSPAQQTTLENWYHTVYDKLINGFIPCWTYYRDDDGGWNWGAAYSMWSLVDQFQLFENMKIGTDKNFYTDLPWVENSINQYIYFMQPDGKTIHLGDGVMNLDGADRVMYLSAKYFNDPRSKWLAQYWSLPENIGWTKPLFDKLLYKDYDAAPVQEPENPLDWWADKVGLSVSRSSWESDAAMITFFNSPSKRAAHEHRDNNSFTIFKDKPLLLDAGHYDSYGSSHYWNYYQRTIAHNSICVYDETETYHNFGQPVSNDGGQIESIPLGNYDDILDPANQRGEWIQYATGNNYAYNVADAQLSYDPEKLDFFRRKLLFIKPDKVILLDHIHLNNVETNQRDLKWIAHFASQPDITGNIIDNEVPGHIVTYDGNDYSASNGNGNLAIRTLIPGNTHTVLIGGTGYEYWVDGINYAPSPAPDLTYYTPGSWRIEVMPDEMPNDGNVIYLHTIGIGDSANPASAGGIAFQNTISVGTDWENTLYFFSANGEINQTHHIFNNVEGGRNVSIFATDLMSGEYYLKIDGTIVSTHNTDDNGILQTSTELSAGNHAVEIINTSMNTANLEENRFMVYPNPAKKELTIKSDKAYKIEEVKLYDLTGKFIAGYTDVRKIDISGLSKGTYILKINSGSKTYSVKFLKE